MNIRRLMLMRQAARVTRNHIMTTIYRQSVGEHTFGALCILMEVGGEHLDWATLMRNLLYHDTCEAITGDVPSPAKWACPPLEDALRQLETKVKREFETQPSTLTVYESELLKFCDTMDLAMFAFEEFTTGNLTMGPVMRNCIDSIMKFGRNNLNSSTMDLFERVNNDYINHVIPRMGVHPYHGALE